VISSALAKFDGTPRPSAPTWMSSCEVEKPTAPSRIAARTSSFIAAISARRGRALGRRVAHHITPHRGVADVAADVQRELALEPAPVVGEAAAAPAEALAHRLAAHALDAREHAGEPVDVVGPRGVEREAAVAGEHGGDAVLHRGRRDRIPVELHVVVGVDVDEAGRDDEAVRVDDAACVVRDAADRGDSPVAHRDVGGVGGQAGSVDDAAAADHEVVGHRRLLQRGRSYILREMFLSGQRSRRIPIGGRHANGGLRPSG
jgi:hypothetical protein